VYPRSKLWITSTGLKSQQKQYPIKHLKKSGGINICLRDKPIPWPPHSGHQYKLKVTKTLIDYVLKILKIKCFCEGGWVVVYLRHIELSAIGTKSRLILIEYIGVIMYDESCQMY